MNHTEDHLGLRFDFLEAPWLIYEKLTTNKKNKQTQSIVFQSHFYVQSSIYAADLVLCINNGEEHPGGRFNSGL